MHIVRSMTSFNLSPTCVHFQILIAVGYHNKRPSTKEIVAAGWCVLLPLHDSLLFIAH